MISVVVGCSSIGLCLAVIAVGIMEYRSEQVGRREHEEIRSEISALQGMLAEHLGHEKAQKILNSAEDTAPIAVPDLAGPGRRHRHLWLVEHPRSTALVALGVLGTALGMIIAFLGGDVNHPTKLPIAIPTTVPAVPPSTSGHTALMPTEPAQPAPTNSTHQPTRVTGAAPVVAELAPTPIGTAIATPNSRLIPPVSPPATTPTLPGTPSTNAPPLAVCAIDFDLWSLANLCLFG